MKKSIISALSILAILALTVATPQTTYACSCMAPGTPQESLQQSAAVFSGLVTGTSKTDQSIQVLFDVENAWKGVNASKVAVVTPTDSAMCGYAFEEGKTYLVYANEDETGKLSVNLCSRTHEVIANDEDMSALGAPLLANTPSRPVSNKNNSTALVIVVIIAAVAIGLKMRKKQS